MVIKLQDFTNEVMLNHNFIICLNGTKCKTIRLCHNNNTGGSKKSAVVSMIVVPSDLPHSYLSGGQVWWTGLALELGDKDNACLIHSFRL